jgi:PadR family transcriptional regulator PadR
MKSDFIGNWTSQVLKGMLPLIVLFLLKKKTLYGYEMIEEIRSVFGIDVAEGTLYPLLVRLLKEDQLNAQWVEQPSGIPRKYYSITPTGRKNLKDMQTYLPGLLSKIN